MIEQEIKLENVLPPTEMWERFGDVQDWIKYGGEFYINSFYFAAELLRSAHKGLNYPDMMKDIPYAYRRIVNRAENSRGPSVLDVVLERILREA